MHVLGPELIFVIHVDLVKFVIAVARLVCPDLLWLCLSRFANIHSGTSILVFSKRDLSHTLPGSSEKRLTGKGGKLNTSQAEPVAANSTAVGQFLSISCRTFFLRAL